MASRVGVCSWSLRPRDVRELAERVRACGVRHVQLHLDPLRMRAAGWDEATTRAALAEAGVTVVSGMMTMAGEDYSSLESIRTTGGVRPDATWEDNRAAARANAALARRLGLTLVSFHAGFLPHDRSDPERDVLLARVRELADIFGDEGVTIALETGQESAATLTAMLDDLARENVGINFDPANMLLYDMGDPVAALRALRPRVLQVHVKDATRSHVADTWGEEVPVGQGDVDWRAFFAVLRATPPPVDLLIEREAGDDRVADIRRALALVERELGR